MSTDNGIAMRNSKPQTMNVLATASGMRPSWNPTRQFSSPQTKSPANISCAVLKLSAMMMTIGPIRGMPSAMSNAAMKKVLRSDRMTTAAWRYLFNCALAIMRESS